MREFLVTKMVCSTCGNTLRLTYDKPDELKGKPYCANEPTGAAMVQQIVYVDPCRTCLLPANEVLAAVNTLVSFATKPSGGTP